MLLSRQPNSALRQYLLLAARFRRNQRQLARNSCSCRCTFPDYIRANNWSAGWFVGEHPTTNRFIGSQLDPEILDPVQDIFKNRFSSRAQISLPCRLGRLQCVSSARKRLGNSQIKVARLRTYPCKDELDLSFSWPCYRYHGPWRPSMARRKSLRRNRQGKLQRQNQQRKLLQRRLQRRMPRQQIRLGKVLCPQSPRLRSARKIGLWCLRAGSCRMWPR